MTLIAAAFQRVKLLLTLARCHCTNPAGGVLVEPVESQREFETTAYVDHDAAKDRGSVAKCRRALDTVADSGGD
jgi:hypothetical protein